MNAHVETHSLKFLETIAYPDISIKRGEAALICGASGSGKSTLLRILNGTLSPSSGTVFISGDAIEQLDVLALRRRVILAGQSPFLFPGTIRENFVRYHGARKAAPPDETVMQAHLERCEVAFKLAHRCQNLSGGERQRIFLAIILSFNPEILLLDEPSAALDEQTSRRVFQNLREYCKENTITQMLVSHDRSIMKDYSDLCIEIGVTP